MKSDIKFLITESVFILLKTKELNNLTITEIANTCDISRTTFYNNFKNIYDVIDYKINIIVNDLYNLYNLNKLRNKNFNSLLYNILKYINSNRATFNIIKKQLFFYFKNKLDNHFINNHINKTNYYIKSGIIINLSILFLDNEVDISFFNKLKID